MLVNIKQPAYSIPATPEAIALLIRGTLKVQELVKLYGYVSINFDFIPQYEELSHVIENVTINYRLEDKSIVIVSANYETLNWQEYFFKPSLHFMARMIERGFDLNVLVATYMYILKAEIHDGQEIEVDCTSASLIFAKYKNTYKLISGWGGSRVKSYEVLKTSA